MAKHVSTASPNEPGPKRRSGLVIALVIALIALCALGGVAILVLSGIVTLGNEPNSTESSPPQSRSGVEQSSHESEALLATSDASLSTKQEEERYFEAHKGRPKVYPLIAQCNGIDLRSPIAPADLTGVLFHQASLRYGLVMTTELPEANAEEVENTHNSRVNNDQIEGDWLDAEAMHLWREQDTTDMDTSIDVGAAADTVLRSPVTGTVVLIRDYMLYDEVPDIEIHIQPDGRPDLDVVLIHTYDPLVKAGDRVEAGVTELSHVRDIAKDVDDVQLAYYTRDGDPGNHTHVQVNDANYEGYRATKLAGAINPN